MKKKRVFGLIGLLLIVLTLAGCQQEKTAEKTASLPLREAMEKALVDKDALVAYTADDLTDLMGILPED